MHKGTQHFIHPFFSDRRAFLDTENLVEQVADIMVESHTKNGVPFFTPSHAKNSLPATPNFGGGSARHITLLASDPGVRGLPASYMKKTATDFPQFVFNFNRPMNYRDATGYKDTYVDPAADPQESASSTEEDGHIKEPSDDQSNHADQGVPQATSSPMCAVILGPVSSTSQLHITPNGQDILAALKERTTQLGTLAEDTDVDFLNEDLSREVHLNAPPNTNLSNGIPMKSVKLQLSQGQSCALLPSTPHAGAGLSKLATDRNIRIHIILHDDPPPLLTSFDQSSEAYISPPIFRQFSGKRPVIMLADSST
jgi:hypothetical protein